MKHVCLLGSTGSIGSQVLDIIRSSQLYLLDAISFGHNIDKAKNPKHSKCHALIVFRISLLFKNKAEL